MPTDGNQAAVRAVAEQVGAAAAKEAIEQFVSQHPELNRPIQAEIPVTLKWAGGIAAAVMTLLMGSACIWLVTTVSEVQVTLARMDERMKAEGPTRETRFATIEARLARLEAEKASLEARMN